MHLDPFLAKKKKKSSKATVIDSSKMMAKNNPYMKKLSPQISKYVDQRHRSFLQSCDNHVYIT